MSRRNDTLFLQNKLKRQLDLRGSKFTFVHQGEDKYHRPTTPVEIEITGIYHEVVSYQSKNTDSGSVTHKKAQPQILCMYEDGVKLSTNDRITWEQSEYMVTGIEDIQQLHAAIQISLEELLNE